MATVILLIAARAAPAGCLLVPPGVQSARAQVIADAVALPGPLTPGGFLLSPARFRVERYDKGTGGRELLVAATTTRHGDGYLSVGEGLDARPGERWRLRGSSSASRVLQTACLGAFALTEPPATPRIAQGGRWLALPRSTYTGRTARRRPQLRSGRLVRLAIPDRDGAPVVRVLPNRYVRLSPTRPGRFALRLPSWRQRARVVVETPSGFFAADLRP